MTHDADDREPPTLHLSAEELRAYIAQTRTADVNTSLSTQLFVAHPRSKPEPPTRLVRMAETRAVLGVSREVAPGFAQPSDATRTCYAPPAQLARPRLGEGSSSQPIRPASIKVARR